MAASGGDAKLFARVGAVKMVHIIMIRNGYTSVALSFDVYL